VRRFRDYRRDLRTVIDKGMAAMPQPHFALAHSMGAAILLDAARDNALPVERLVALAPMIDLSMVTRPRLARVAARVLNGLGLGRSYIPGGGDTTISTKPFDGNRLTRDPMRYARNAVLASSHPQLSNGDPTIRWLAEAFRFMDRLGHPATPLDIRLPTLVLAAGADPIVSTPAVERFAARLKTGMALVLPGARHEILNETDDVRAAFWAAFDAFVPGEISRPAAISAVEEGKDGLVHAPVA
jgi:lysophospholipase